MMQASFNGRNALGIASAAGWFSLGTGAAPAYVGGEMVGSVGGGWLGTELGGWIAGYMFDLKY